MIKKMFSRTQLMLGAEALERLSRARVAVFGVGGVGGNAVEALVRGGVGAVDIVDDDVFCESNLNRQVFALNSTLGMYKVDAAAERLRDINPDCTVVCHRKFFTPENASEFDFTKYDYVVDAIDTVTAKIALVMCARAAGVPIISAMGAGNKLDPTALRVSDISETSVCPLAKVMRTELKRRGVRRLKVVWSNELPMPRAADALAPEGSANGDMTEKNGVSVNDRAAEKGEASANDYASKNENASANGYASGNVGMSVEGNASANGRASESENVPANGYAAEKNGASVKGCVPEKGEASANGYALKNENTSANGYAAENSNAPKNAEKSAAVGTARKGVGKRSTPGSVSFVPAAAGLMIAGEVIKDLTGIRGMGRGN